MTQDDKELNDFSYALQAISRLELEEVITEFWTVLRKQAISDLTHEGLHVEDFDRYEEYGRIRMTMVNRLRLMLMAKLNYQTISLTEILNEEVEDAIRAEIVEKEHKDLIQRVCDRFDTKQFVEKLLTIKPYKYRYRIVQTHPECFVVEKYDKFLWFDWWSTKRYFASRESAEKYIVDLHFQKQVIKELSYDTHPSS